MWQIVNLNRTLARYGALSPWWYRRYLFSQCDAIRVENNNQRSNEAIPSDYAFLSSILLKPPFHACTIDVQNIHKINNLRNLFGIILPETFVCSSVAKTYK